MTSALASLFIIAAFVVILAQMHANTTPPIPETSNGLGFKGKATSTPTLSIPILLEAIEEVENTPNHYIGASGERSKYQITPTVWAMWSSKPFESASSSRLPDLQETYRVARHHIHHIRAALHAKEAPETPYLIALAWTAGLTAVLNDCASDRKKDYAQRVENIYHSLTPSE